MSLLDSPGNDSDSSLEVTVLELLCSTGLTLGLAESVTGGLISTRLTEVPGSSSVFRGSIVAYHRDLKSSLLGTPGLTGEEVSVVSEEMVLAMASGVCELLKSDVGLATTGVAGPDSHEGVDPGTVWIGLWLDGIGRARQLYSPLGRDRIRHSTAFAALDLLRLGLLLRSSLPD